MTHALTLAPQNTLSTAHPDIAGLVADWHAALTLLVSANDLSATSKATYINGMKRFTAWAAVANAAISDDTLREWKAALVADGYKPGSINTWLAGVRAFFAWAVGARRLAYNPAQGVKGAKRKGTSSKHKREALTDAEVLRVLASEDRHTTTGKRNTALIYLMAYTGARTVEIHRADLGDLKTDSGRLVLAVQGKGQTESDEVIVIAHPEAEAALYDWLAVRGDAPGPLFVGVGNRHHGRLSLRAIRGIVKDAYARAGVRGANKTTHSLRHTAITNAIRHGAPLQKAQAMARHANVATTMIYFHETDRVENPAEGFIQYTKDTK